jgi:hypothetical protein
VSISPQAFCARVYCAVLDDVAINPVAGIATLTGVLKDHERSRPINIHLEGLSGVAWHGVPKEPEGFFELSTVEIGPASGSRARWRVRFEPWDSAELEFHCEAVILNGDLVSGPGAWRQDSLDGPVAV